jgi:hypothetical protein
MGLSLNSEWNTYRALETDKYISDMFTVSDKDCYVSFSNSNTRYNVTPEWVESFHVTKERMEREAKEAELRKSQKQNKRLRSMVKKVILNNPCTIIIWGDGSKTVVKCHESDTYDPEKGILACMAKKLYENTNLFNEVINAYVDFEKATSCATASLEALAEQIKDMEYTLEYKDECIETLQTEIYWLEEERNELQDELDRCRCHTTQ